MRRASAVLSVSLLLALGSCAATATPASGPGSLAQAAWPVVALQRLVYPADYPAAALVNRQQGTVKFRLTIESSGRVTGCTITSSSGSPWLDSTTCAILRRRARFSPARGPSGRPEESTFEDSLVWRLYSDRNSLMSASVENRPKPLTSGKGGMRTLA